MLMVINLQLFDYCFIIHSLNLIVFGLRSYFTKFHQSLDQDHLAIKLGIYFLTSLWLKPNVHNPSLLKLEGNQGRFAIDEVALVMLPSQK